MADDLEVLPRRGGTLSMVGAGDVDHLDPALAYHTVTRGILRAYTRQLVGYAASCDREEAGRIVADLATEVPTVANGGITEGGTRFTFRIRPGIRWNAPTGHRAVTAADVVRGIKRLAHPLAPSTGLAYYLSTVAGLAAFREALADGPRDPEVVAELMERTPLDGASVLGDDEVALTTLHPTSDFLNMLALPFVTPAPVEYLPYQPGSPELTAVLLSCGPYAVVRHDPGESIVLERSPSWDPTTDDLRAAHLDRIEVRQGVAETVAHDLVATGEADMLWDIQPLTERLPELLRTGDPRLEVYPAGLFSPYLVVNFADRANGDAIARREVRRALGYALDKVAVARVWGGPRLCEIANQILPPLCSAHRLTTRTTSADGHGDPERARRLLAEAGYADGVTLRLVFRDRDIHPETAEAVATALARAGIRIELVPVSINEFFSEYLAPPAGVPRGDWDLALTGWEPDWYGNNARTYLQPMVDSRGVGRDGDWAANFGRYRSERVNSLLTAALGCPDEVAAGELFRKVEDQVLADGAIVPILFAHQYWFHAEHVRNWLPYPVLNGDLTHLWLDDRPTDPPPRGARP